MVLVMTNIVVRFGLIVVFLIAMFIEVTHPGATLPGIIALAALLGLIAPPMLVGMASWWAVVAIITGIVMLLIEVFVTPGFGAPGVFGLILLFMGLVGVFVPTGNGLLPSSPEARGDLLYYSAAVMLAMATAAVGIYFVARHFGTLPGLRRLVLQDPNRSEDALSFLDTMGEPEAQAVRVGEVGVVITPMRPAGRVELNGRVVDAVAEFGMIQAGQRVRVTSVDGVRIGVEAIDTPAGGSA
jgi:membrane-bound serine protease (ClpP class)